MQKLPSHDELDALVDELFPVLGTERSGDDFFFDPESITESTRSYYADLMKWVGIEQQVLPPERICIHADRNYPANLERQRGGSEGYTLFLDNGLYRSLDAVRLALAHQFTHMRLVVDEQQNPSEAQKCRPLHLERASEKSDSKDDKSTKPGKRKSKKVVDEEEPSTETETEVDEDLAEMEVRTEVASFVLGFGKLVLNGACAWDALEPRGGSFERVTTLPTSSLAHLYKQVAKRADVGSKAAKAGLSDEAKDLAGPAKSKK